MDINKSQLCGWPVGRDSHMDKIKTILIKYTKNCVEKFYPSPLASVGIEENKLSDMTIWFFRKSEYYNSVQN